MTEILMYNIGAKKAITIKNICRALNIGFREVDKADYGYKLGFLLGITDDNTAKTGESFDDEMLYLAGFNDGLLNIFLKLSRSKKCVVALKAVMTETNVNYTSFELYNEISAEHKAMRSGKSIH